MWRETQNPAGTLQFLLFFVYENSNIKMFSVKISNIIGAPCVSIFKTKWRSGRTRAREALKGWMGFSGCILGFILPQCVAVAAAAMGHQQPQCAGALSVSCFSSYQDASCPEREGNPHHKVPTVAKDSWIQRIVVSITPGGGSQAPGHGQTPPEPWGELGPIASPAAQPLWVWPGALELPYPTAGGFAQGSLRWRLEGDPLWITRVDYFIAEMSKLAVVELPSSSFLSLGEKLGLASHKHFYHLDVPSHFAPNLVSRPVKKQNRDISFGVPWICLLEILLFPSPQAFQILVKYSFCSSYFILASLYVTGSTGWGTLAVELSRM